MGIEGPVTAEHLRMADRHIMDWPVYKLSHRGRAGNLVGGLGEVIAMEWLKKAGLNPSMDNVIRYDMRLGDVMIDIKTKDRTVAPARFHEASVPQYVYDRQVPDCYLFLSLLRKGEAYVRAYILGVISRKRFDEIKYGVPAGKKENGANFFCPAWNVKLQALSDPQELIRYVQQGAYES